MKHFLYALLIIMLTFSARSQDSVTRTWKFSLMSEAISLPSYKLIKKPVHPGFSIGVNIKTKTKGHHSHILDANFGYFYHPLMGNSFLLWPEYRFEQLFLKRFSIECMGGLGYKHNIADRTVYKSNGDGTFKKTTDFGTPQAFLILGIGLGYELNSKIKVFCDYKPTVAIPFAKLVPFETQTLFNVGIQVKFKKDK